MSLMDVPAKGEPFAIPVPNATGLTVPSPAITALPGLWTVRRPLFGRPSLRRCADTRYGEPGIALLHFTPAPVQSEDEGDELLAELYNAAAHLDIADLGTQVAPYVREAYPGWRRVFVLAQWQLVHAGPSNLYLSLVAAESALEPWDPAYAAYQRDLADDAERERRHAERAHAEAEANARVRAVVADSHARLRALPVTPPADPALADRAVTIALNELVWLLDHQTTPGPASPVPAPAPETLTAVKDHA